MKGNGIEFITDTQSLYPILLKGIRNRMVGYVPQIVKYNIRKNYHLTKYKLKKRGIKNL